MISRGAPDFVADISAPTGTSGLGAGYIRCRGFALGPEDRSSQKVSTGAPDLLAEISAPHRNFRSEGRIYPVAVSCATGRFPGGV